MPKLNAADRGHHLGAPLAPLLSVAGVEALEALEAEPRTVAYTLGKLHACQCALPLFGNYVRMMDKICFLPAALDFIDERYP